MWRPGAAAPVADVPDTPANLEAGAAVPAYNALHGQSFGHQRRALPIFAYKNAILYALEQYQVLVLVGETGSGKTTRECGFCSGIVFEGTTCS